MSDFEILFWLGFFHEAFPINGLIAAFCWFLCAIQFGNEIFISRLKPILLIGSVLISAALFLGAIILTDSTINRLMKGQGVKIPDYSMQRPEGTAHLSDIRVTRPLRPKAYRYGENMASFVAALHVLFSILILPIILAFHIAIKKIGFGKSSTQDNRQLKE